MTAAQRATLEQMAGYAEQFARREARPSEVQWHQSRADALRAALGTCGTCRHGDTSQTDSDWCFCAAPSTEPKRFPFMFTLMPLGERCTGWTAKEGA